MWTSINRSYKLFEIFSIRARSESLRHAQKTYKVYFFLAAIHKKSKSDVMVIDTFIILRSFSFDIWNLSLQPSSYVFFSNTFPTSILQYLRYRSKYASLVIYDFSLKSYVFHILNLFRVGFFGAAHGWGWDKKAPRPL